MKNSFRSTILWVRLNIIYQLIYYDIQKALEKEALTLPQLDILVCINRTRGLTLGEISNRLLTTGGNVTGVMDRLERSGYVYRERDKTDRRVIRAKLTPKGITLHKKILPIFKIKLDEIMKVLEPEEQRQLSRLLKKLSQPLLTSVSDKKRKGGELC